jgi:hypothetical protein
MLVGWVDKAVGTGQVHMSLVCLGEAGAAVEGGSQEGGREGDGQVWRPGCPPAGGAAAACTGMAGVTDGWYMHMEVGLEANAT